MSTSTAESLVPNACSRYAVEADQLPLHCPMPGTSQWDSHPKVYLPIKENGGFAKCPYCGAEYTLKD